MLIGKFVEFKKQIASTTESYSTFKNPLFNILIIILIGSYNTHLLLTTFLFNFFHILKYCIKE